MGSERSCNDSDNVNRKEAQVVPRNIISAMYFGDDDHHLWHFNHPEGGDEGREGREESRARSQGKSEDY